MADRFVDQATATLSPVYDTQISQLQSQIPAIQQLYQSLTQGLQTQSQQQLDTGVQQISEDASARGVLRSSLPVDARTSLTSSLGTALNQGLANLGIQQLGAVSDIQGKIGSLGVSKAGSIADLSNSLRTTDLEQQKFEYQKQQDAQNFQLEEQKLAIQRAAASPGPTPDISGIDSTLSKLVGSDGKVSPSTYSQAKVLWVNQGGKIADFNALFGPKYAEGAKSPIQQYYTK